MFYLKGFVLEVYLSGSGAKFIFGHKENSVTNGNDSRAKGLFKSRFAFELQEM